MKSDFEQLYKKGRFTMANISPTPSKFTDGEMNQMLESFRTKTLPTLKKLKTTGEYDVKIGLASYFSLFISNFPDHDPVLMGAIINQAWRIVNEDSPEVVELQPHRVRREVTPPIG